MALTSGHMWPHNPSIASLKRQAEGAVRVEQEIRLGRSHRADVLIGSLCGALLAAVIAYDFTRVLLERFW